MDEKTRSAFGGKCGGSACGLAAAAGIEANISCRRCSVRKLCGSRFVRRKRHARDGLISDCGRIVAERKEKKAGSTFLL